MEAVQTRDENLARAPIGLISGLSEGTESSKFPEIRSTTGKLEAQVHDLTVRTPQSDKRDVGGSGKGVLKLWVAIHVLFESRDLCQSNCLQVISLRHRSMTIEMIT